MTEQVVVPRAVVRKTGRPSRLNPEVQQALMVELGKGLSVPWAARIVGLKPDTVEKWIKRGRGELADRAATPEYVNFVVEVYRVRAELLGKLASYAIARAETDPGLALQLLDRFDRRWGFGDPRNDGDDGAQDEEEERLRLASGTAMAQDVPDPDEDEPTEPVTLRERERTITIPASRVEEFADLLSGRKKDRDGDTSDRLSRFRESAGDVPSG